VRDRSQNKSRQHPAQRSVVEHRGEPRWHGSPLVQTNLLGGKPSMNEGMLVNISRRGAWITNPPAVGESIKIRLASIDLFDLGRSVEVIRSCRVYREGGARNGCAVVFREPLTDDELKLLVDPDPVATTRLFDAVQKVLAEMPNPERDVLGLLYGIGDGYQYSLSEVARIFKTNTNQIRLWEARGIRLAQELSPLASVFERAQDERPHVQAMDIVRQTRKLTPYLLDHLKKHQSDIVKLPWEVFEHLVAEFYASWGFPEVRLVGRNSRTAADIFAVQKPAPDGTRVRYFVEVKRWKDRVGVEVIDRVYGAMLAERPEWGWHLAIIVSAVGFKDFKKYSVDELTRKGVELRGPNDIVGWLRDYRLSDKGLWLPNPMFLDLS